MDQPESSSDCCLCSFKSSNADEMELHIWTDHSEIFKPVTSLVVTTEEDDSDKDVKFDISGKQDAVKVRQEEPSCSTSARPPTPNLNENLLPIKRFECVKCDAIFWSKPDLVSHYKSDHLHGRVICEICYQVFDSNTSYAKHKVEAHPKQQQQQQQAVRSRRSRSFQLTQCEDCGKEFNRKDCLLRHKKTVHTGDKIACKICGKMVGKISLLRHIQFVHEGRKRDDTEQDCTICNKPIKRIRFACHMREVHGGEKKKRSTICRICHIDLGNKHKLQKHYKEHREQSETV